MEFFFLLILYIDDILLATNDFGLLHETKNIFSSNFGMKDTGEIIYVIKIEIYQDRSHGMLSFPQKTYINKGMQNKSICI